MTEIFLGRKVTETRPVNRFKTDKTFKSRLIGSTLNVVIHIVNGRVVLAIANAHDTAERTNKCEPTRTPGLGQELSNEQSLEPVFDKAGKE